MKLYTIGFTQKRAEVFFELLCRNDVQRLLDIRLKPQGQLAGFAKKEDLPYFLARLANGCQYLHMPILAPTEDILGDYRADSDWERYVLRFESLMDQRDVPAALNRAEFEALSTCLLCSEPTAEKCHRRLVAERLVQSWTGVEVIHL
jgi:uncharacterized protein (DUF488 family)